MDKKEQLRQKALEYIDELEVFYIPIEEKFAELKSLLSDLEDSICVLPVLGITETYESIMRDKMIMYEAQISAFRALYSYLHQHVIGPNEERVITRRGPLTVEDELDIKEE